MTIELHQIYDDSSLPRRLRAPIDATLERLIAARAVERFADRDASLWNPSRATQASIRERLGWLDLPAPADIAVLESWAAGVRATGARSVLVVATGGAGDVARLWRDLPVTRSSPLRIAVLDSIDPARVTTTLAPLDLARTLVLLVAPHESSVAFEALSRIVAERLTSAGGTTQQMLGLTTPGSAADSWLRSRGVAIQYTPPDIGERWSALSQIGLMLAALAGIDLVSLVGGATAVLDAAMSHDPRRNPAVRLGASLGALAQGGHDLLCFDAAAALRPLAVWMRLLLTGSLSKHRRGFVTLFEQPAMRAVDRLVIALGDDAALLDDGNRPVAPVLRVAADDTASLGAALMVWQIGVAIAAIVLGLNPFDQPDTDAFDHALRRRLAEGALPPLPHREPIATAGLRRLLGESRWMLLAKYGATPGDAALLPESLNEPDRAPICVVEPLRDLAWATQALHAGRADAPVLLRDAIAAVDLVVPGAAWSLADLCRSRLAVDLATWVRAGRRICVIGGEQGTPG